MKWRHIILMLATALALAVVTPVSRSQSSAPPEPNQAAIEAMRQAGHLERRARLVQWRQEMYQRRQQFREQAERDHLEAWDQTQRRAFGATPAQWRVLKPKLDALNALTSDAYARIRPTVSFGITETPGRVSHCQWRWARSAEKRSDAVLTETETTCETLLGMLSNEQTPIETIWEQVEQLRRQRKQAADEAEAARAKLREILPLRQEAALMVLDW